MCLHLEKVFGNGKMKLELMFSFNGLNFDFNCAMFLKKTF